MAVRGRGNARPQSAPRELPGQVNYPDVLRMYFMAIYRCLNYDSGSSVSGDRRQNPRDKEMVDLFRALKLRDTEPTNQGIVERVERAMGSGDPALMEWAVNQVLLEKSFLRTAAADSLAAPFAEPYIRDHWSISWSDSAFFGASGRLWSITLCEEIGGDILYIQLTTNVPKFEDLRQCLMLGMAHPYTKTAARPRRLIMGHRVARYYSQLVDFLQPYGCVAVLESKVDTANACKNNDTDPLGHNHWDNFSYASGVVERADDYIIYADDCLEQQEYMRAVEYCTLAIEQRPNDANLYIHRAHAYLLQELHQFALDDANKAISLNKASKSAYKKKVEAYMGLKNWEAALKLCNKVLVKNNGDPFFEAQRVLAQKELGIAAPSDLLD